jgi:hypothetical protein
MTTTVEKELLDLERQYWQALQDEDFNAALRLTDEPCFLTGAQGVLSLDHRALMGMMKHGQGIAKLRAFDIDPDVKLRMIGDDVAVLAYKVREDLIVDGKPLQLDAADASTWVRRDGRWVCVLHTESIAGDPFGRDHRATS